jgi:hypothetical protein
LKLHRPLRRNAFSLCALLVLAWCGRCLAQDHEVLCGNGDGSFQAESASGVTVKVAAAKVGGLSTRACAATLRWDKQSLTIASNATEFDVDAFGVDLGLGVPIAAFQVRNSANQCCMEYEIYSLEKPPRLLRTITGGDFFSAADTDMDGRVEIWTTDAAAVNGLDKLDLAELDSAPTIMLRFEHGDLLDASHEFQTYFDDQIAWLRKQLNPEDLRDFKSSDGKLSVTAASAAERQHRLRQVKIRILEVVWNYLYSGRESQAWNSLAEMWPDADVPRIRAAIADARTHGILSQVAGVSAVKKTKPVRIFDAITLSSGGKAEVTPPEPILLRRPPPPGIPDQPSSPTELLLELIIDSAGKVRSAEPTGRVKMDAALLLATKGWKFIPALNAGRPVASRTRVAVSLRQ